MTRGVRWLRPRDHGQLGCRANFGRVKVFEFHNKDTCLGGGGRVSTFPELDLTLDAYQIGITSYVIGCLRTHLRRRGLKLT